MYSSLPTSSSLLTDDWSSYDIGVWQQAGLEIRTAVESVEAAVAIAAPLPAATEWQARGVAALHETIAEQNALLLLQTMILRANSEDWQAVRIR